MLFEHLKTIANSAPASSGLRVEQSFVSYADIVKNVEHLAAGFTLMGFEKGMRIALLLPNGPQFFMLTYALAAVGAIAVPLNEASGEAELEWLSKKCQFAAIICADNLLGVAEKLLSFEPEKKTVIIALSAGVASFSIAGLLKTPTCILPEIPPRTVASYLLSSGSTGRQKLVPHTHEQLIACGTIAATSLKLTPDDIVLNALPAHHAFGFLNGCFETMSGGASTYYWADPGPLILSRKRFLDLIRQVKISVMPGVPYIFQTLGEIRQPIELPSMRLIYSSGIALRREIYDAFKQRFNLTLHQGYGCTETGMISLNGAGCASSPWNSVGRASKQVSVEVLPNDSSEDGVGELFVTTPALIDGYVDALGKDNAAFVNGGYLTGDLGRLDEHNNIYIVGRTKLIIEVAGEKIDPFEIEDVLCCFPEIVEAVVIGVPDPHTAEQRLKAFIVCKGEVNIDQLVQFCRTKLMPFKVPYIIEPIAKIPKSATGKVQRAKLM